MCCLQAHQASSGSEGRPFALQKPASVAGNVRHGMVMTSDYHVYTCAEFVKDHKHTEGNVGVKVINRRNEDMTTEKLCLVRCNGPRRLRLFLEESTDFIEQLLKDEIREGQAMDLHKCLVSAEVQSREFGLRSDQRLQTMSFEEVQVEARRLEKIRLVNEANGAAAAAAAAAAGTASTGNDGLGSGNSGSYRKHFLVFILRCIVQIFGCSV